MLHLHDHKGITVLQKLLQKHTTPDSFQYADRLDDGDYTLIQPYVKIESELSSCTILLVLYYNYFLVTFNKYAPVKKQVIRW